MTTTDIPDLPGFLDRRSQPKAASTPGFAKPLVYSFTFLNTYDICPYQCFRRYVKKDIPFFETPEMAWGNKVHSAMEYRVGGKPLPTEMQQWEGLVAPIAARGGKAEMRMGVTREGKPTDFFGKDVFLRGKVDVTMISGTAAFLPDWKTGRSREEPFELEIQAVMVHAANPYLTKIAGAYVWLKENRMGQIYDLTDTRSTWARTNNKVEQIEDSMKAGEWEKTKGPLCGWCPCTDCEHNPKKSA